MKPRTKLQVRVNDLSLGLPKLSHKIEPWAFKNCIEHTGYRNKVRTSCLSCGGVWPTSSMKIKTEVCPCCGWKLKILTTRKQKAGDWARFAVMEVAEDFQVTRFFEIQCHMKAAEKPKCYTREIMQHWVLPSGKFEIMSVQVGGLGLAYDHFCGGELSIKNKHDLWKYNISVYKIFPQMTLQPVYRRNGFVSAITDIKPFDLLKYLPTDTKSETLIKAKQFNLLREHLGDRRSGTYRHWASVKICIRAGYVVKNAITWLDYLDLISWFGKDMRNAKYVCPANMKKEHDRLVKKKAEITKRQELQRRMRQMEADQIEYEKAKSAFFGIEFRDKDLEIKVLESVMEFIHEGDVLKHCVYTNAYYKKENSLILSARVGGKPVETIEVQLSEMKIMQSRGLKNIATQYNQQIIDLLKKNLKVIRKRYRELKSVAA